MKLGVRDLINSALFSVLLIVVTFCVDMIGFIPVTMPIVPFLANLITGPIFMLYACKIKGFGQMCITGIFCIILFSLGGHGIYVLISFTIFTLLAELILYKGQYSNINSFRLAYSVYSLSFIGMFLPLYTARDAYIKQLINQGYGEKYAKTLMSVLPNWSLAPIMLGAVIGAFLGCTIGIKFLRKHFEKANMV